MPTPKYCSKKCELLGKRKELKQRTAIRLGDLVARNRRDRERPLDLEDPLDMCIFESVVDEILRKEKLLPKEDVLINLRDIDKLEKMGKWPPPDGKIL